MARDFQLGTLRYRLQFSPAGDNSMYSQSFSPMNHISCFQIFVSKPFTYALALHELGADTVHKYVGQEPSGRMFNELILDYNSK